LTTNGSNAERITDFPNAFYHNGASKLVKATVSSAGADTTLNVTSGVVNLAGNDVNRSVTAGIGKIPVRSFVIGETSNTITVRSPAAETHQFVAGASYNLSIENGPGRSVEDGTVTASSATVTSASANFQSGTFNGTNNLTGDVGQSIDGPCIPSGSTITAFTNTSTVTISAPASAGCTTLAASATLSIGGWNTASFRASSQRAVSDLAVSGTSLFSASANFKQTDIGLLAKGTGLPGNAFISAVADSTHATLNAPAAKPVAGIFAVIGLRSATAPAKDGVDTAATLNTELVLNPALVPGVPECGQGIYAGQNISGTWYAPDKMYLKATSKDPIFTNDNHLGLLAASQRVQRTLQGNPIIGQIKFLTSVIEFAAYVTETSAGNAQIVFPFVPTALGVCPGTAIVTKFSFNGSFLSSSLNPTGYGRPGSGGLRGLSPVRADGTTLVYGSNGSATLENWTADAISSTNVGTDSATQKLTWDGSGALNASLVNGQPMQISCNLDCTTIGLKDATAGTVYYVDCASAGLACTPGGSFKLSTTPFAAINGTFPGVAPAYVLLKGGSHTEGASYNNFDQKPNFPVTAQSSTNIAFSPLNTQTSPSCSVVRPADSTNLTTAFPCPSK